ncbi:MAG: UDP-3-O-(3-hydroxymyristoyl)glucosamine N-acyltransferase [Bacteroidales bacterium]|nr:UDP-3-O-(3-hydroxymyristoyl)glucosamine N-acyltransferase [Bacteroidales bacterium]
MEFTAKIISDFLKGTIEGNPEEKVTDISRIEEGKKGTLAFLANPKYNKYLYTTEASIVLVNNDLKLEGEVKATLIRVSDAYQAFASLLNLYTSSLPKKRGVEPQAFINDNATIGEDCYIGAFAYLGGNVKIGKSTLIYPHVYLGDNVTVGDNTILYPGVKVYKECKIGNNCIIHGGTIIGSDGFGFATEKGKFQKIPQIGNVIIEDDVEIGSNVSIDRATIGSTIIRKGAKLDNLIQVAHNVEIGKNTGIASQAGISGSTKIGEQCIIAGQVGFVGHINIANKTTIAAQSGVVGDVKNEGEIILGSPAIDIRDARKSIAVYRKLPEIYSNINQLEKQLKELQDGSNKE